MKYQIDVSQIRNLPFCESAIRLIHLLGDNDLGENLYNTNDWPDSNVYWNDIFIQSSSSFFNIAARIHRLCFFSDKSSPHYYRYVGPPLGFPLRPEEIKKLSLNPPRTYQEVFLNYHFFISKARNEPRLAICYKGSDNTNEIKRLYCQKNKKYEPLFSLPRYLVSWGDNGRNYGPEGNEPQFLVLHDVMLEMDLLLKQRINYLTNYEIKKVQS